MTRQPRHGSARLELLLDEDVFEDTRLSRVLSVARQPAAAEELAGLTEARAAFVLALNPPLTTRASSGRPARSRSLAGRLLALKAVAAVSGATLVGGVALAATQANFLGNSPQHQKNQQAPQASPPRMQRPAAPQGSWIASASVSPTHPPAPHGKPAGQPAHLPPRSAGSVHQKQTHAPNPHRSSASSPPGQSNPPQRKKTPPPQTNNGRTEHPSQPPKARGPARQDIVAQGRPEYR
jgi:hypothetical protein